MTDSMWGGVIVKASREEDLYVHWSTIAEGPLWVGTRAQAAKYGYDEDRLARAEATGTSAQHEWAEGGWDDDPCFIAEQAGLVPRALVGAYAQAVLGGRKQEARAMLVPLGCDGAGD